MPLGFAAIAADFWDLRDGTETTAPSGRRGWIRLPVGSTVLNLDRGNGTDAGIGLLAIFRLDLGLLTVRLDLNFDFDGINLPELL